MCHCLMQVENRFLNMHDIPSSRHCEGPKLRSIYLAISTVCCLTKGRIPFITLRNKVKEIRKLLIIGCLDGCLAWLSNTGTPLVIRFSCNNFKKLEMMLPNKQGKPPNEFEMFYTKINITQK